MNSSVNLEKNYGYTAWASNVAQEVGDDRKLSRADMAKIAKECGDEDGVFEEADLVDAGFSKNDAKAIWAELKRTGFKEVGLNFEASFLQKGVAVTGQVVGQVKQQVVAHVKQVEKQVTAVVGQVKEKAAATVKQVKKAVGEVKQQVATTYKQVKKTVVAKAGEIKEGAARIYTQVKKEVKAVGTEIANTAKIIGKNTGDFVKGVGTGFVHGAQHLGKSVATFAQEHPVATGFILAGAATLLIIGTGGLAAAAVGPLVAGAASSIVSGVATGGMILGGTIATVKVGQAVYEGSKGDWSKAGERIGEGAFEAAVTFAPGAGLSGMKNFVKSTEAVAEGLNGAAKLVEGVEQVANIEAKAAGLMSKAHTVHSVEKFLHMAEHVIAPGEIVSAKLPEAIHIGAEAFGGHEEPVHKKEPVTI